MPASILIVTAVAAEMDAVRRGLGNNSCYTVIAGGVGPAAAAAATAIELCRHNSYKLVISTGIGGGFASSAPVGSTVVSNEIWAADLGAEDHDSFLTVEQLGFGQCKIAVPDKLSLACCQLLKSKGLTAQHAPIATVSAATGTEATAQMRQALISNLAAEGMEGFGVATAAQICKLPVMEIRTISNIAGPRDRNSWKIKEALQQLETVFTILENELCQFTI